MIVWSVEHSVWIQNRSVVCAGDQRGNRKGISLRSLFHSPLLFRCSTCSTRFYNKEKRYIYICIRAWSGILYYRFTVLKESGRDKASASKPCLALCGCMVEYVLV